MDKDDFVEARPVIVALVAMIHFTMRQVPAEVSFDRAEEFVEEMAKRNGWDLSEVRRGEAGENGDGNDPT